MTFDEVIAHELGHVLSLNEDQRTDDESLDTYADDESSFAETAYLNQFYQEFWNGRYPDWAPDGGADQASSLYAEHKDDLSLITRQRIQRKTLQSPSRISC